MSQRLSRICLSLVAVLGASVASAEYTPFHELRQEHASIDEAIAAMPSSDLNGTLNRISALYTRSTVRDVGPNLFPQLHGNFSDGMSNALADLQADWVDGTASLTLEQKLVLIQTIEVAASSRLVSIYNTQPPCQTVCDPGPCQTCIQVTPPAVGMLNGVVGLFYNDMNAMIAEYNAETGSNIASLPSVLAAGNFDFHLDRIRATFLTIKGVESIDD